MIERTPSKVSTLGAVRAGFGHALLALFAISGLINLLIGSIYVLQAYDRVLGKRGCRAAFLWGCGPACSAV